MYNNSFSYINDFEKAQKLADSILDKKLIVHIPDKILKLLDIMDYMQKNKCTCGGKMIYFELYVPLKILKNLY